MKGVILAGGTGTRLYPITSVTSKQLLPVYDKPMIYYPLTTLIENGVTELCLISTPTDLPRFRQLLGEGRSWGISIEYREQVRPDGIAQAIVVAETFIGESAVALILGDNVFCESTELQHAFTTFEGGATIFGYEVYDPQRYGVVQLREDGCAIAIEEKPTHPNSNYAVPGLYLYDPDVVAIAKQLRPSARGELEITDVHRAYLRQRRLRVCRLSREMTWLDAGTSSSLHEAASYIQAIERRRGIKIGCPEVAAFRQGLISHAHFEALTTRMPDCEYRNYLIAVATEAKHVS